MDERHETLVGAMGGEHRLRRQAVREARDVELWEGRAVLARERGLEDMASAAHARAQQHRRMEHLLLARADDIRAEIERMRAEAASTRWLGRAPPAELSLESRFARLEIEREIEAIRASISSAVTSSGTNGQSD